MMKILTVVGARPQFVKAAVISRLIREQYADRIEEVLLHTGQHYDENMSRIFFREMRIPEADINLAIGGGSHGAMTGRMLEKIEAVLLEKRPDLVLVYGDTNSTLAGSLAASKLHIPVAHVEAGLRSYNMKMPEEQNRVLTDHISTFLFCPTGQAVKNLAAEGISGNSNSGRGGARRNDRGDQVDDPGNAPREAQGDARRVHRTGDIMLDASLFYRSLPHELSISPPEDFYLITLHRAENTDDPARLSAIVKAVNSFTDIPALLPLHPRTKKMMEQFGLSFADHVRITPPVGYLDMIALEDRCRFILTDSGGVQKEAYFFKKPCITLRDQTEWVETVAAGANVLVGADREAIAAALCAPPTPKNWPELYGTGRAGSEIIDLILK